MSRIKVKNFGPIKEGCIENDGWIDIEKITVFIGNQGSGKSTIAKLISTLMWIEKALVRGDIPIGYLSSGSNFKYILSYQKIDDYYKDNTQIIYEGDAYRIGSDGRIAFENKIGEIGFKYPKIMYIPDSRNFVTTAEKPTMNTNLPKYLNDFLKEYEISKQGHGKKGLQLPSVM